MSTDISTRPTARPAAFLALACVGSFATAPAFARDSGPGDDAADQHSDIVVTGQKDRPARDPKQVAPLVDTPKSIVEIPADVIKQTGSATLADALRTVPGITFGAAEGGNPIGDRPFIRGFDSQGSIYVDGVRDLASQTRETFAIDSVQVVRGSDSTLGGRGSAGGTINIISKLPTSQSFATLDASYGNASYKRITGDASYRLSDTVAFRIQGLWHDQDMAGRDAIWQRRWGVAPSLTIGNGTPTRLTASFYHLHSNELPDSGIPYLYVCSTTVCNSPTTGNVYTAPALGHVTLANGQTGDVARDTFYGLKDRDFRTSNSDQAMLRVEHDFGAVTLRNTVRWNRDSQEYIYLLPDDSNGDVFGLYSAATGRISPAPGTTNGTTGGAELTGGGYVWRRANTRYGYDDALIDQTDLSGTVTTGGIRHSFAVGTEFSWEKDRRGAYVLATGATISPRCDTVTLARFYCTSLFNPNPNDPWVNYTSDTATTPAAIVRGAPNTETQNNATTQAAYAFDSITLAKPLILNLGARIDRFQSTLTPPSAAGVPQDQHLSRTDTLFNWQAGLVLKPTGETSLYASYATAATPPNSLLGEGREDNALPTATTTVAGAIGQLAPQKTKTYEVGAKASLFRERLQLSGDVFQTDIDNARVNIDANTVAFIGKSRVRGVELSATGTILPGWTVFGGYTHLDPVIVDGGNASLAVPAAFGRAATTVFVPSVNTGKQLPNTVRNSLSLTSSLVVAKRFLIGGTAIYNDRQYGGYADNRSASQNAAGAITVTPATIVLYRYVPSYWRFDAQASVDLTSHLTLRVNALNLTDKAYFSQAYASHYATMAPGRTVFGTVELKF